MSTEPERVERYTEAVSSTPLDQDASPDQVVTDQLVVTEVEAIARAVMAVADAEQEALRAEVERLRDVADATIHYRNLAIVKDAQPTDMLTRYDADLCRDWSTMNHEGGWRNDQPEIWEELEAAEAKVAAVEALHYKRTTYTGYVCDVCCDEGGAYVEWPCPTIAALSGARGAGG